MDVKTDPRNPRLDAVAEAKASAATGAAYLHTSHCLGDGTIMVSTMGSPDGEARGSFLLLDSKLNLIGPWSSDVSSFGVR